MAFTINFEASKQSLPKPVNRNWHDPFYWEFSCDMAHESRHDCGAAETDWNTPKTVHDLYEIYNAPHIAIEERRAQAAHYIVNKQLTLIEAKKAYYPEHIRPMMEKRAIKPDPHPDAPVRAAPERHPGTAETLSWSDLINERPVS